MRFGEGADVGGPGGWGEAGAGGADAGVAWGERALAGSSVGLWLDGGKYGVEGCE